MNNCPSYLNCYECNLPVDYSKDYTDTMSVTKTYVQDYKIGDIVSHFLYGGGVIVRLYYQNDGSFADVVFGNDDFVSQTPLSLLDKK